MNLQTPILFLVFNRPETTQQVFQRIREAKPKRLYVAADGPREGNSDDKEKCRKVRDIATSVDWDCEVNTLFQDKNLGCGVGPMTGISWFFENEEMGIILEDDCLPDLSFFGFCQELLQRYQEDFRIMHINGNNYNAGKSRFSESECSYHFGRMPQAWGWASWRRAWEKLDWELSRLSSFRKMTYLNTLFSKKTHAKRQLRRWKLVKGGKEDIWDFQWQFSVISNHGLTIVPKKNLISNIGFGEDATHTVKPKSKSIKADLKTEEIKFPLIHPEVIVPDSKIDSWYQKNMLGFLSYTERIKNKIKIFMR